MNFNCPTCNDRLSPDGHCDRCAAQYDEIAAAGPDPWLVAGGLDLRTLQDQDDADVARQRKNEHLFRSVRDGWARRAFERGRDKTSGAGRVPRQSGDGQVTGPDPAGAPVAEATR